MPLDLETAVADRHKHSGECKLRNVNECKKCRRYSEQLRAAYDAADTDERFASVLKRSEQLTQTGTI